MESETVTFVYSRQV